MSTEKTDSVNVMIDMKQPVMKATLGPDKKTIVLVATTLINKGTGWTVKPVYNGDIARTFIEVDVYRRLMKYNTALVPFFRVSAYKGPIIAAHGEDFYHFLQKHARISASAAAILGILPVPEEFVKPEVFKKIVVGKVPSSKKKKTTTKKNR